MVISSEESIHSLKENEQYLLQIVTQLGEVGEISKTNTQRIEELGNRSAVINEMVELIREVANKTNILSINASIEASRSGQAGSGFSVVDAEIRELSKETIDSVKKAEKAAKEIRELLSTIIASSADESEKVVTSGRILKNIFTQIRAIIERINKTMILHRK